jgi:hypothetical protein
MIMASLASILKSNGAKASDKPYKAAAGNADTIPEAVEKWQSFLASVVEYNTKGSNDETGAARSVISQAPDASYVVCLKKGNVVLELGGKKHFSVDTQENAVSLVEALSELLGNKEHSNDVYDWMLKHRQLNRKKSKGKAK